MSADDRISVIIPAYNSARFLPRSIESVLAQSHPAMPIVVDDGSKDDTPQVVARYRDRVGYIRKENGGVSSAWNAGLAAAETPWVAFLDADDEWFPHKIERQMAVLRKHPDLRWCACSAELSQAGVSRPAPASDWARFQLARHGYLPNYFEAAERKVYIHIGGIVVDRQLIHQIGGFRLGIEGVEDADIQDRLALAAPAIGYVEEPSYRYYVDVPSSMGKNGLRTRRRLQSIASVIPEAQAAGIPTAEVYNSYARKVAFRLLLAGAYGGQQLEPEEMEAHLRRLPPTFGQGLVLRVMRLLPRPVAERLEGRIRDWHSAMQG